jgi:hypothetical protein
MKDIPKSIHLIKMKRRRRKRFFVIFSLIIITLGLLIYALGRISSNYQLVLSNTRITGLKIIDQNDIESVIKKNMQGKYFYMFDKSNFLIYPRQKIYNDLLVNFPRIESLAVYRNGLNTLSVDITERAGAYLYCGPKVPENKSEIGENCYFINNDGYIFDEAPYFSGDIYLKYFLDLNIQDENYLGKQMMEPERFQKIIRFVEDIKSLNFKPAYVTFEENIVSIYLETNGTITPRIIFREEDDLNVIFENLKIAMEQKEFADEIKENYHKLLYVDLRFENKVLYKFE